MKILGTLVLTAITALTVTNSYAVPDNNNNRNSPWGIALGSEDSGKYPQFNPLLKDAGISWIRYFAEWESVQPQQGEWRWEWSDKFVANARQNGLSVAGFFLYLTKWNSANPANSRTFPIKDMNLYREYVRVTAARYKNEIRYWEVYNEPNSPAFNTNGSTKDYADMVRAAYEEVKKIDPGIKVGITVAAFDLHWLNQAIQDGAAGHFDYICVHPYDSVGLLFGSETSFLRLRESVRKMLDSNRQRQDIEIWLTEIGLTTTAQPERLNRQAEALAKTYILGLAQGFEKTFWFEAVGPKYGDGVHAIIDRDMTPFPAYHALKAMTAALGRNPHYLGWLNLGGNSYGFVFESPETGKTLALWAVGNTAKVRFDTTVTVTNLTGQNSVNAPQQPLTLTSRPLLVKNFDPALAATAVANNAKPFPWTPDYRQTRTVSVELGPTNLSHGLRQGNNDPRTDGLTTHGERDGVTYRGTDLARRRPFIYFEVDRSFMDWGDHDCEITVTARRANPAYPAIINLVYESVTGYHEYGKRAPRPGLNSELLRESDSYRAPEPWYLASGEEWQTKTWKIKDAQFIGKWGWNFQLNLEASPGDVWVKKVEVRKLPASWWRNK